MITLETVLLRRQGILYRHLPPETVLVRESGPEVMVLNGVAGRVLDVIDGRTTLGGIVAALSREYEAPIQTLEQDVLAFGEELLQAGIVTVPPASEEPG